MCLTRGSNPPPGYLPDGNGTESFGAGEGRPKEWIPPTTPTPGHTASSPGGTFMTSARTCQGSGGGPRWGSPSSPHPVRLAEAEMLGADSDHQEKRKRVAWLRVAGAGSRRQEDQKRVVFASPLALRTGAKTREAGSFGSKSFFEIRAQGYVFIVFFF
uniref:Uncharacterized protein n=1 Tax=Myotis myotis TaxID=51298 RepID=A0A7J7QUR4_MYOMY|nr:hypothetical protein mMyoMyo1_011565 [Myotis myotis]